MDKSPKLKVMLACGGTGGHLFPGIAIAEAIASSKPDTSIVFAGTERGFESQVIPKMGWPLISVGSTSIKDRKGLGRLAAYARLPFSILKALSVIKKEKPDVFIGVRGLCSRTAHDGIGILEDSDDDYRTQCDRRIHEPHPWPLRRPCLHGFF